MIDPISFVTEPSCATTLESLWQSRRQLAVLGGMLAFASAVILVPQPDAAPTAAHWTIRTPRVVRAVAISPDGKLLAAGGDSGSATLWDVETGSVFETISGGGESIRALAFTPDGRQLVIGGGSAAHQQGELVVWDVATRQRTQLLPWINGPVYAVAVSEDGEMLAASGADGCVRFWRTDDWSLQQTYRLHGHDVYAIRFAPDQQSVITAGADDAVMIWDHQTGHIKGRMHIPEGGTVFALAVTPDGRTLASAHSSDQLVRLWDLPSRELKEYRQGMLGHVRAMAFSPDGRSLASAAGMWTMPGDVRLTPMSSGSHSFSLKGHDNVAYCLAFSPDGRLLVTGSGDETVRLWDVAGGHEVRRLQAGE